MSQHEYKLPDPQRPFWIEIDGEEIDLHQLILDRISSTLSAVRDDLEWIRENWSHHPFSPASAFSIAIDVVDNIQRTTRIVSPVESEDIARQETANHKPNL